MMMNSNRRRPRTRAGFTLIELAVAVFFIALLLGSILVPLQAQVEQRQVTDTTNSLEQVKEALIGFAITNGYLPCPDRLTGAGANDGQEDRTGSDCAVAASGVAEGNLPWQTLGVPAADAWGNRFRYVVTATFADQTPVFSLTTVGALRICASQGCSAPAALANNIPAVIISHGRNGWGAIGADAGTARAVPTGDDELENIGSHPGKSPTIVVSRPPSQAGSPAGEFDDIVTWIPATILMSRMVAAGKLP